MPRPRTSPTRSRRRSLRCLLGFHSWVTRSNDAGEWYSACTRCDASDEWTPTGLGWRLPGV